MVKNDGESVKMECLKSIHHLTEESRQKSILCLILYKKDGIKRSG